MKFPVVILALVFSSASHAVLTLEDRAFNIDGTVSGASFDDDLSTIGTLTDGLDALSLDVSGAGPHKVRGFFDFEIDELVNS